MYGNCQNCKYGVTGWTDNNDKLLEQGYSPVGYKSLDTELMVKCDNGFNDKNLQWWMENKNKPSSEVSSMDCYEPTEHTETLNSMIDLVDKIDNLLDKNKNNGSKVIR